LELIESGRFGTLPPQVGRLVGIAAKNTDRLVRLAGDVVDLHQMRRGQLHLRLDKITLPEIVNQAVQAVQDVAERAAVPIEVSCTELAHLHVDTGRTQMNAWSPSRHPAFRAALARTRTIALPAAAISCEAWTAIDAAEIIAAALPRT
jgi:signal transduction histidine kinase